MLHTPRSSMATGVLLVTILFGVGCINDLVNPVSAQDGCISHPLPPDVVDKIVTAADVAISQLKENNCSCKEDKDENLDGHALATLALLQHSLSTTREEFSASKMHLENGLTEIQATLVELKNELAELQKNYESVTSNSTSAKCKDGWFLFQNSCYYFSSTKATWEKGRQECLNMDADYVKISTDAEFAFILSLVIADTWVGLNDGEYEGTFKWVSDGTVHEMNRAWWIRSQPNNHGGNQDCVDILFSEGRKLLNDHECTKSFFFICEMEPERFPEE